MAVSSSEVLKLTADDARSLGVLEQRIDQYLSVNFAGPERPFDTGITDLKWNICEEIRRIYTSAGWSVGFSHPSNFVAQTFSTLDGSTRPRSLPTLINFAPSFDVTKQKVVSGPTKKNKKVKK